MLGLESTSCTSENLLRTGECVFNLASDDMASSVNAIARTTGSEVVPEGKNVRGYVHCKDKFGATGLTEMESKFVKPPGIQECPVSMEARLVEKKNLFGNKPVEGIEVFAFEVEIVKVSVHEKLRLKGFENRIDVDEWKPMIMMFSELFGLREGRLAKSRLAGIEEELYGFFDEEDETAKPKVDESVEIVEGAPELATGFQ